MPTTMDLNKIFSLDFLYQLNVAFRSMEALENRISHVSPARASFPKAQQQPTG